MFEKKVKLERGALVSNVIKKDGSKKRPIPLNTVDMMKAASTQLGMGPHHAMQIAERL